MDWTTTGCAAFPSTSFRKWAPLQLCLLSHCPSGFPHDSSLTLLFPDTPECLVLITVIVVLVIATGALVWGAILEIRYTGPYTLIATSSGQKWRQAIILALLETIFIPLLGLAEPVLSPYPGQWPAFPLFCSGIWIAVLPIAILYKRWSFEWQLNNYRRMDKAIKMGGAYGRRILASPFLRWYTKVVMTTELRRFLEEGFSENVADEK